ncbi:papain family cysteine protease [Ancylostoma ceylanicum]|uniref:Papain family cysteine protease n=1 Tax=Ancylostoma ceylanicum TaxID=53326 RepID=A0A0D6LVB5_9BILA|nr:papain family cysteine protease [Ancylostoma ceylanicum]
MYIQSDDIPDYTLVKCEGGWPIRAWEYIEKSANSLKPGKCGYCWYLKGVCKPYAFHPCGYHPGQTYFGDCPKHLWPTPRCEKFCRRGYPIPYEKDKYYGKPEPMFQLCNNISTVVYRCGVQGLSSYTLPKDEKAIQRDLMKYGPSVATYKVFQDFRLYKRGIYEHKFGEQTGAHAVKLIGWGVENGTKYWHIANSWSPDWGEKGYFRIIRGKNDCDIEDGITGGTFKL